MKGRYSPQPAGLAAAASLALVSLSASAFAGEGQPSAWQMNLQNMVTENGMRIVSFHNWLIVMTVVISVFVLALLAYVAVRFSEKANPVPSKTTHHAGLEVAWTVIPILILVAISIPSFRLLRFQLEYPVADVTIKAIGKQWYWSYEYPKDQGGFSFDSIMLTDKERTDPANQPRLLAVDNEVVIPVNKIVIMQVTAADVLHAFAMPSFGIKSDAVPGRLNQVWFKAEKEGIYYGQCSELCGVSHAFMPIAIRVVSDAQYASWIEGAKKKFASLDAQQPARQIAATQTNQQ